MEQHGNELDDQNQSEEEDEHQTDRLQSQWLVRDQNLSFTKKNIFIQLLCGFSTFQLLIFVLIN